MAMKTEPKHPMEGLVTKAQAKQMEAIIQDNGDRLRWAMRETIKSDAYRDPEGAAHFMTGVAAGIMVTLHWLSHNKA